jgi:hypothetical protein
MELPSATATLSRVNRPSLILVLLAVGIVSLSAWLLLRPQHSLPDDPLAAVPADAYGVLSVRVERVLASQAWQRLVVERGQARGIERAIKTCGFNPLARIDQLTVFARPGPQKDVARFAFTARGKLKHEQLIDCARKLSGRTGLPLTHEEIEGIHTVRSQKGSSRVAFVARDGIVGGDAESVRDVILTLLGKRESWAKHQALHALHAEMSAGSELAAVVQSPEKLLPMLGKLGSLADGALALHKIKALGARLSLKRELLAGGAVVLTDSPSRATALAQLLSAQRERVLSIPGIGFTALSSPLREAQIDTNGSRVNLSGTIKLRSAEALIELLSVF